MQWARAIYIVEAKKLETQQPQSLRVKYSESQHYLSSKRFRNIWGFTVDPAHP